MSVKVIESVQHKELPFSRNLVATILAYLLVADLIASNSISSSLLYLSTASSPNLKMIGIL